MAAFTPCQFTQGHPFFCVIEVKPDCLGQP